MANISDKFKAADITKTYLTDSVRSSAYTITHSASIAVPVDSSGGAFTVTLNDSVPLHTRVRIHDISGSCGTNAVAIRSGALVQIDELNTNGGAVEFGFDGAEWKRIDRFENILDRDTATETVTLNKGTDKLAAGSFSAEDGTFGLAAVPTIQRVSDADFTNFGPNVDVQADHVKNVVSPAANPFNDGDYQTSDTTTSGGSDYVITTSGNLNPGSYPPWKVYDGATGGGFAGSWAAPAFATTAWTQIDVLTPMTFAVLDFYTVAPLDTIRVLGSNDGTNFDELLGSYAISGNETGITLTSPGAYRYYRVEVNYSDPGSNVGDAIWVSELLFYEGAAESTNNTFDSQLAFAAAGTYVPNSFKAYDKDGVQILGAGKLNVAYAVDGDPLTSISAGDYSDLALEPGSPFLRRLSDDGDASFTSFPGTAGFDQNFTSEVATDSGEDLSVSQVRLEKGLAAPKVYRQFRLTASDNFSLANRLKDCKIQGYNGSTWEDLTVVSTSGDGSNLGNTLTLNSGNGDQLEVTTDNTTEYDDYGLLFINGHSGTTGIIGLTEFEGQEYSFIPDQETFKALGNIAYTSQFDMRFQAVGSQTISRIELSTPDQVQEFGQDGSVEWKRDGVAYAGISDEGFRLPELTTAERDALVSPAEGLMIHNTTTDKLNVRSGGVWVSINPTTSIDDNGDSTAITITSDENVGFGTATPNARHSLGPGIGVKSLVYDDNTTNFAGFGIDVAGGNAFDVLCHGNGGFVAFGKTGNSLATLLSGYAEFARFDDDGLKFNGDTAAANALNDYEEGTFTPTFANVGTGTYLQQLGKYTKIGRLVHCDIQIQLSAVGTASGNVQVQGLPFAANSSHPSGTSAIHGNAWSVGRSSLNGLMGISSTNIDFWHGASNSLTLITHADLGTGSMYFSITYEV